MPGTLADAVVGCRHRDRHCAGLEGYSDDGPPIPIVAGVFAAAVVFAFALDTVKVVLFERL
jgi:hypothetical protein